MLKIWSNAVRSVAKSNLPKIQIMNILFTALSISMEYSEILKAFA